MREILFRGKLPDGEWAEGYVVKGSCTYILTAKNMHYMCVSVMGHASVDVLPVKPETVGQYTGLTDRHGKRIFEGDICRFKEWNKGKMCWVGEIRYEHQQFIISGGANEECEIPFVLQLSRFIPECLEVIGNIHDNPEMIGGKEDGKND